MLDCRCIRFYWVKEEERERKRKREREREREGRTAPHVGDTGCIPLRERFAEHRGTAKRYTKETKR